MPRGVYDRSKAKPRRKKRGPRVVVGNETPSIDEKETRFKVIRGKPKKYTYQRLEALQILIDVCKSKNLTVKQAAGLLKVAITVAEGG